MIHSHHAQIRISEEELVALLGPVPSQTLSADAVPMSTVRVRVADVGVDMWFKYRILFLLTVAVTYAGKIFFFPELAAGNFEPGGEVETLMRYLQYRAGFIVLISAVYLYSYLKDWHFEQVSLVSLGVGVTALLLDYFNAYVYLSQTPVQWVAGLIALRFMAVFCLLMNAMNARYAPSMPRRLWS